MLQHFMRYVVRSIFLLFGTFFPLSSKNVSFSGRGTVVMGASCSSFSSYTSSLLSGGKAERGRRVSSRSEEERMEEEYSSQCASLSRQQASTTPPSTLERKRRSGFLLTSIAGDEKSELIRHSLKLTAASSSAYNSTAGHGKEMKERRRSLLMDEDSFESLRSAQTIKYEQVNNFNYFMFPLPNRYFIPPPPSLSSVDLIYILLSPLSSE